METALNQLLPYLQTHILPHYPFNAVQVIPVRKIFRLVAGKDSYALKRVTSRPEKIVTLYHLYLYLLNRGLTELPTFIPANDGSLYVSAPDGYYYVTRWIEGRECRFSNPGEVTRAARALARFHKAAEGYSPPPGALISASWGRLPRTFAKRRRDLEKFLDQARAETTPFSVLFAEIAPMELSAASHALDLLRNSSYPKLVAEARERRTLCHLDFAQNNLLVQNNRLFIIDFDNNKFDITLRDLEKFIWRIFLKNHWDTALTRKALCAYQSLYPLEPGSGLVLEALMTFPHPLWRIAESYYEKQKPWGEKEFFRCLRSYSRQLHKKGAFLKFLRSSLP